ncbi:hypothetical protein Y032_0016g2903 [Ancylostoma ceylanicum]|uniref:Uncharacterized protein n=1 Tax=Ancylostoma ceylanicum TaxID=53326 RepID=A0A016V7J6_9BILA|nr:hypothetical protein Y032_0016g2903 [Ancylostoma ceylanicum]
MTVGNVKETVETIKENKEISGKLTISAPYLVWDLVGIPVIHRSGDHLTPVSMPFRSADSLNDRVVWILVGCH